MFKDELNAGTGDITVWINSPGGDCVAAAQIYNMLMDYKGNVTVTAPKNPTAGGIAGSYVGTMESVTARGDVTANEKYVTGVAKFGENSYAGGITGSMSGTLKNMTAAGIITATNDSTLSDTRYAYAGGLVGSSGSGLTVDGGKALTTNTGGCPLPVPECRVRRFSCRFVLPRTLKGGKGG